MNTNPECVVCIFKQALNTVRLATDDTDKQTAALTETARLLLDADLSGPAPDAAQCAYQAVTNITGIADPFAELKRESNDIAMSMVPRLRTLIADSADPLDTALHIAVAGNIIDLGIGHEFDLATDVDTIIQRAFAVDAADELRAELQPGRKILYLGDNAGEIVFDRLLIEYLLTTGVDITFTVKSTPIINDATMDDAKAVGMTDVVPVIETGSGDIGVNWNNVSDEFQQAFDAADLVIAKGHGNFETCDLRPEDFYFLLKAKCQVVADALGVNDGDIVFKHSPRR